MRAPRLRLAALLLGSLPWLPLLAGTPASGGPGAHHQGLRARVTVEGPGFVRVRSAALQALGFQPRQGVHVTQAGERVPVLQDSVADDLVFLATRHAGRCSYTLHATAGPSGPGGRGRVPAHAVRARAHRRAHRTAPVPRHPGHAVAAAQMKDFGGMLSFDLASGRLEDAMKVASSTRLFALAESLGGVESLIGHPASMTHASIPREQRLASGVTDTLLRLSVGVEGVQDLLKDLEAALDLV